MQKQGPTGVQKQGPTYVQKQIVSIRPTVSASEDQDNCYIRPTTPGIKVKRHARVSTDAMPVPAEFYCRDNTTMGR